MSCDNYFEDKGITYKRITVEDSGSQKLNDKFQEALAFIVKFHLACMSMCLVFSVDVCVNVYKFSTAVIMNRIHDIHTNGFVLSYLDLPFSLSLHIFSFLSLPNISPYFYPPHYLVLTSPLHISPSSSLFLLLHTFFTFIYSFITILLHTFMPLHPHTLVPPLPHIFTPTFFPPICRRGTEIQLHNPHPLHGWSVTLYHSHHCLSHDLLWPYHADSIPIG